MDCVERCNLTTEGVIFQRTEWRTNFRWGLHPRNECV
jgi:hypothetical protein